MPDSWVSASEEVAEFSFVTTAEGIAVIDNPDRKKNKTAIPFCDVSHFWAGQGSTVLGAKGRTGRRNISADLSGVLFYCGVSSLPKISEGVFYKSEIIRPADRVHLEVTGSMEGSAPLTVNISSLRRESVRSGANHLGR